MTDQSNGMEVDPGFLSEIAKSSIVTKHAMKTEQFPFERTWVPDFMGFLDIRLTGEEMVKRYVRFMLRFGEYSGVGIKTGMGMGRCAYPLTENAAVVMSVTTLKQYEIRPGIRILLRTA